jgi:hypothetical protein
MARENEHLSGDEPTQTLHRVRMLDIDARWNEVMDFCDHPDQKGDFDWNPDDIEDGDRQDATFYFTNEVTAFHFKMRFG